MFNQRKRSAKQIQEGWATFLRVLARQSKLKFVIGKGVGAATNGQTVWLPALPEQLNEDDMVLFKSNAHHEVGHCIHSDIPWFQAFAKEHGKFAQFLLNALDDVFMERKQARFSRMAEGVFRKSATIMFERKQFRDGSASPAEAVGCYVLTYLFSRKWPEYRQPFAVHDKSFDAHFGEHAEEVKANLNTILNSEFPNVTSTRDAGALALRIIAMLKVQSQQEEEEEEEDQDQDQDQGNDQDQDQDQNGQNGDEGDNDQDQDQNNGQGDDGEADNDQEGQGQGDDSEPKGDEEEAGNGEGEGEGDAGRDAEGDEEGKGGDADADQEADGDADGDAQSQSSGSKGKSLKDIVDEMLNTDLGDQEVFDKSKAMDDLSKEIGSGQHPDYSASSQVQNLEIGSDVDYENSEQPSGGAGSEQKTVDGMSICGSDREAAAALEKHVDRKANVLAAKLRVLLSNREEAEVHTARRGRLGEKNLFRLRLDDNRIFERKEAIELPTAAVSVAADLSGSTEFARIQLACPCCGSAQHAMASMTDKAYCQGCGNWFTFDRSTVKVPTSAAEAIQQSLLLLEKVLEQLGTPREIIGFAPKTGGTVNTVVRTFADSHMTAVSRIGGLASQVGGRWTPIGEAVMQASLRLQAHQSQKKVMFVLTDGDPSSVEKAVETTQAAQQAGIKVVYLLIGEEVREDWLATAGIPYVHAKTAADLCPILLDKVGELLG